MPITFDMMTQFKFRADILNPLIVAVASQNQFLIVYHLSGINFLFSSLGPWAITLRYSSKLTL